MMSWCCYGNNACDVAGKSKEAEKKRINKELGNIRSQFKSEFVYVHVCMCVYVCVCMCVYVCVCVHDVCMCMCMCAHWP